MASLILNGGTLLPLPLSSLSSISKSQSLFISLSSSSLSLSSSPCFSPLPSVNCGRGDKKTAKGKRFNHSFGNARPRDEKKGRGPPRVPVPPAPPRKDRFEDVGEKIKIEIDESLFSSDGIGGTSKMLPINVMTIETAAIEMVEMGLFACLSHQSALSAYNFGLKNWCRNFLSADATRGKVSAYGHFSVSCLLHAPVHLDMSSIDHLLLGDLYTVYCGRGDKKTAKGKRFNHSFGNARPRDKKKGRGPPRVPVPPAPPRKDRFEDDGEKIKIEIDESLFSS
ncbi:30S ribosomal protein [Dillenia turbinata]|uniref:30S ribosomal protein n=1 Tax=Dillenia turbinata TaxID=194707 RepID=A0AAN8W4J3_9MAGN